MIADLFSEIISLVELHPLAAYAVVFLLAMSEALPGIGVVVPGTAIILGVSALIPSGVVKLLPILAATMAGAIVGDGLSFWLGHRYQGSLLTVWPMSRHPDIADKGEAFFKRHGDKSVFFARFIPGVRAVVPLIAGMVGMSPFRFYVANTLSAVAWSLSHVLPAVFVGAAFAQFGTAAKPLAILFAAAVIGVWVLGKTIRLSWQFGGGFIVRSVARASDWARRTDSVAAGAVARLMGKTPSDVRTLLVAGAVIVLAAWLFLGVFEDVVEGDPLVRADQSVFQGLGALRTDIGDAVMITLTELGDTVVVIAVTVAACLYLALRRAWRSAVFLFLAVAGGSLVNTVIKATLHRARPGSMDYQGWSEFSFPSGHSTVNAILYGFLAVLIARELRPPLRWPVAFAAMFVAMSIAFSRVYIGAHWFSDVVAGLSFGTLWLAVVSVVYLRGKAERVRPGIFVMVVGLTLGVAGGFNVYSRHQTDVGRYAVRHQTLSLTENDWLRDGWKLFSGRRVDLTGEDEEPLTLQVAGPLSDIEQRLVAVGWKRPPSVFANGAAWLAPNTGPDDLPAFPLLASGRAPDLVMIRTGISRDRTVLRLWRSDLTVSDALSAPVWFGSAVHENLSTFAWITTRTTAKEDYSASRDEVAEAFANIVHVVAAPSTNKWDGRIALATVSGPR